MSKPKARKLSATKNVTHPARDPLSDGSIGALQKLWNKYYVTELKKRVQVDASKIGNAAKKIV